MAVYAKLERTQPQCSSKHSTFINTSNSGLTKVIAVSSREEARLDFIACILCHDCEVIEVGIASELYSIEHFGHVDLRQQYCVILFKLTHLLTA